ncbi:MAG: hypothetical protein ACT6Q3_14270, partial [Sphingopyxis sp.]
MIDLSELPERGEPYEPGASAYLLQEMQLYGHRPYEDEPDARPLPCDRLAGGAVVDIFDALAGCLVGTYEGPPHVGAMRVATGMTDVHYLLHAPQGDTYADLLFTMIERRDTMEFFRECAAEQFRIHARKAWTPRTGSRVRHKTMTAAMIDSRDFMDKRLREKAKAL